MAKQTGLFRFTGKLDNVIGYQRNGIHYVRSMPEKVTQTSATRHAARNFGIASTKGKLIRRAVTPYLTRHDGTSVNRLNKALVRSGSRQLQAVESFRFNRHTAVNKFFVVPAVYTDGLLKIPAQELPALRRATHLEVCVIAARINFAERRVAAVKAVRKVIDLEEAFNGMELELSVGGKGALIITLQVQACEMHNGKRLPILNRGYMAADIVRVIAPAVWEADTRKNGRKRTGWSPSWRDAAEGKRAGRSNFLPGRRSIANHDLAASHDSVASHDVVIASRRAASVSRAAKQSPA